MRSSAEAREHELANKLRGLTAVYDAKQRRSQCMTEAARDAEIDNLQPELTKLLDRHAELCRKRSEVKPPQQIPSEMHRAAAQYELWSKAQERQTKAQRDLEEVVATLAEARQALADFQPQLEALEKEWEPLPAKRAANDMEQRAARELLALVKKGKCPTCLRPMDAADGVEVEKKLSVLTAAGNTLAMQEKQASADLQEARTWFRKQSDYIQGLQRAEASNQAILAAAPAKPAGFDPEGYQKLVDAYNEAVKRFEQTQKVTEQIEALQKTVGEIQSKLEALRSIDVLTENEAFELQKFFQEVADTQQAYNAAQMNQLKWATTLEQLRKQYNELEQEQRNGERAREQVRILSRCAELLHRDQLPRIVMASFRLELNNELQTILARFNAEFTADLTEDFDVVVHFGRHRNKPAMPSTSGGQKTLLSIAFHMAMTKLLAGSIPLMVMDEPTNHLGEADRLQVRNVLLNLKRTIGQTTCLLVATHDQLLHPAFDRIIDISDRERSAS